MQILVISDIHANYEALDAVLHDSAGQYEAVWCLGDLVGYGPKPNECVERVKSLPGLTCLVGNHDKAVLGDLDINSFNNDARTALEWTYHNLTSANFSYLHSLPSITEVGAFTLAHASPRQPIWEYILNRMIARENFAFFYSPYCLVGHTHVPVVFRESELSDECDEALPDYTAPMKLNHQRMIINPGSVGQPRDNNPFSSYALLDTDNGLWKYRRVPYNVENTQRQLRNLGFPERLITRIAQGW